ncbi:MAG: ATP-binding cassette domain-containing protein, partial [Methylococcales bacterium]|nr:ATP-binding cassette domain-containing protein [Methylococcales bacterium]
MIQITHLQKVVDQTTQIDMAALTVKAGEVTAVIQLSGHRKQLFLELLTGQTAPTAGTIRLAGNDPFLNRQQFATHFGYLPAENGLYPRLSVRQNLTFYADLYRIPHARADEVLAQVGLTDRASSNADALPTGLARRLAFGRAILHQPGVLLLADPFANCDAPSISWLSRLIEEVAKKETAVLLIAPESSDIVQLSHTIVVMEQGKLSHSYKPDDKKGDRKLPFRIPARLEGKVALINPADILYAAAEDGKTYLHTGNGRVPTHLTLNDVEARLARSGFFRAHR